MQHTEIELIVLRQMSDTGDKGGGNGAIITPLGEHFVARGVVDFSLAVTIGGDGQGLPLHTGVEDPQDEVEEAMIAEFALRTALVSAVSWNCFLGVGLIM
jgi:hypothetical protein